VGYRYVVLGAGRQGVAAAYDLARHGEAERITLLDRDVAIARAGAERLNRLLGRRVADTAVGDASQPQTLASLLVEADGLLSAASYRFNLGLARLAIETKTHMVDLGATQASSASSSPSTATPREQGSPSFPTAGWDRG
jgi:lysine 6-dehydrogenase